MPFMTHRHQFVQRHTGHRRAQRLLLARLDRGTGEPMWRIPRGNRVLNSQPDVDRVLAVNPKFVYATDRSGRPANSRRA